MVIEKLVSDEYKLELQRVLMGDDMSWQWEKSSTGKDCISLFTHHMSLGKKIKSVELFNFCTDILHNFCARTSFNIQEIYRSRVNCFYKTIISEKDFSEIKHRDFPDMADKNLYTFIYYVNDSDGDNFVFNEDGSVREQKTPKAGDCLIFKSNDLHCAVPPKINLRRVTVVFMFTLKE